MHPEPDVLVQGYRSRFGGLWPDRTDAAQQLAARRAAGRLTDLDVERLTEWMRDGFVVIPGALEPAALDTLQRGIEDVWAGKHPRAHVEYWQAGQQRIEPVRPEHKALRAKLLDVHVCSPQIRDALFAPALVRFLTLLFERQPLAFQTLYFQRGTEQPMHQDTAYVLVDAPLELAGCWLALEDIAPGSGELEYYVGSHALPEQVWEGGTKGMPPGHPGHDAWLASLHTQAAAHGLQRRRFRPRRGDMLVWHADLVHGGAPIEDEHRTRLSLVTHFCPEDRAPGYFRHCPHSLRLPHGSGVQWCYPCRWPPQPPLERGAGDGPALP